MLEFIAVLFENSHGQLLPRVFACGLTVRELRSAINMADVTLRGFPLAVWCTRRAAVRV
jgi:hypothetical protein